MAAWWHGRFGNRRGGRRSASASGRLQRGTSPTIPNLPSSHPLALLALIALLFLAGCGNNPYPSDEWDESVIYSTFLEDPKNLDPSYSYYVDEAEVIDVINLSYYQYHYLKRPVELELALGAEPARREARVVWETVDGKKTRRQGEVWSFRLKRGIRFQDDPCFRATAGKGREVVAADILFAIRRMADPKVNCPVVSWLQDKVLGFDAYMKASKARNERNQGMDWTREVEGLQPDPKDPYSFRIVLNQPFPQLRFLMAMHFTTPIAREAVEYYGKDGYGRHPVGCGPYVMKEWLEKQRIVLERNPNFFGQTYPAEGAPGDREAGLLADAGHPLPLADKVVFTILRENITGWNFFLQGYLDAWVLRADNFSQAISPSRDLSPEMKARGIRLSMANNPNLDYLAFNMDDPVVGGRSEQKKKLRQAISLSIDADELIALRLGGFGLPAQFLIPKDLFAYDPNYRNPYRQPNLERAKQLLAEAGYPKGISRKTGTVLTLNYDNALTTSEGRQFVGLLRRQIERLGIRVQSRPALETTYRDNLDQGKFQLIVGGWYADYPDPENFLFLLYGPYRRPEGSNTADYDSPEFDRLFVKMRAMDDTPERRAVIDQMRAVAVEDCPWVYLYHRQSLNLVQRWYRNVKPHPVANDVYKYRRVDVVERERTRLAWNRPDYWPAIFLGLFLVVGTAPAVATVRRRRSARGRRGS